MFQAFISGLLAFVMAISTTVAGATPANHDSNPSNSVKQIGQQVSSYVKENKPAIVNKPVQTGQNSKPAHPEHPDTPKNTKDEDDNPDQSILIGTPVIVCQACQILEPMPILAQPPVLKDITPEPNSGIGQSLVPTLPDSAKTDGREFGSNVSGSVRP